MMPAILDGHLFTYSRVRALRSFIQTGMKDMRKVAAATGLKAKGFESRACCVESDCHLGWK